jgi:hypothetical protein
VSVPQSSDVPDLTARGAAPVSRDVHCLAGCRDINRVAERTGFRRDDCIASFGDDLSTVDCVAMIHQWSPRGKRSQSLCLPTRSVAHARSGGGLGSAPHTAIKCGTTATAAGEKKTAAA